MPARIALRLRFLICTWKAENGFAAPGVVAGVITGLLAFSFFGLACIASFAATSAGIGAAPSRPRMHALKPHQTFPDHGIPACWNFLEDIEVHELHFLQGESKIR